MAARLTADGWQRTEETAVEGTTVRVKMTCANCGSNREICTCQRRADREWTVRESVGGVTVRRVDNRLARSLWADPETRP